MAKPHADLSIVPPATADSGGSVVAQQPLPEPAERNGRVGPAHQPDRTDGAAAVLGPQHNRPTTISPQNRGRQSALADSPVATALVDDRARARNRRTASIPAATEQERLGAHVPDHALLRRYVTDGDQAAFRTLVRQHERVVLGTCQRVLGDPHLAQEAFQATFMVLARKAGVLDARQPLTSWLRKVAFRAALRLRGAAARRRRREQQAARPAAVVTSLSADLEKKEIFQALAEELQRLPEKYRAPLALCYLDGRSHGDAAQLIGLPRGSMAKRIREGLFRLRKRLVARGFMG
jgi:RNA polymerase sigma factor (sigma-70 family)